MTSLSSRLRTAVRELGIPRLRDGELICGACEQPGRLASKDDRGYLIEHDGRIFPCRVPPGEVGALLYEPAAWRVR